MNPTVLPSCRFSSSPSLQKPLCPPPALNIIDLSWPHCLRWKKVRFNQSGVGTQFTSPHPTWSLPLNLVSEKCLRSPFPIPMHCKAVVANILPFRRGQSVSQSVSQNQFSPFQLLSSSQVPTPKIRPILEEGVKFLHFCPLTSALPMAMAFEHSWGMVFGENGKAAPNITVIPTQIESTTRWNEMK